MNNRRWLKSTTSLALMVVAGVVLTKATIPDAKGVIHGCYSKSGGSIRVIDDSVTTCNANETSLSWNMTGPIGPIGRKDRLGPLDLRGLSDLKDSKGHQDRLVLRGRKGRLVPAPRMSPVRRE